MLMLVFEFVAVFVFGFPLLAVVGEGLVPPVPGVLDPFDPSLPFKLLVFVFLLVLVFDVLAEVLEGGLLVVPLVAVVPLEAVAAEEAFAETVLLLLGGATLVGDDLAEELLFGAGAGLLEAAGFADFAGAALVVCGPAGLEWLDRARGVAVEASKRNIAARMEVVVILVVILVSPFFFRAACSALHFLHGGKLETFRGFFCLPKTNRGRPLNEDRPLYTKEVL